MRQVHRSHAGHNRVDALTPTQIKGYILTLRGMGLSIYTVNSDLRTIKAWMRFCVAEGLLDKSPFENVTFPKLPKLQKPALTVQQVKSLLDAADGRAKTIILILIDSGLRATELCMLNGGDIDLSTGVVTVRQGKGSKESGVVSGE
ncbi:MAG: tyrosine-type recombinase/integrase [Caldilineaceae bacterium]